MQVVKDFAFVAPVVSDVTGDTQIGVLPVLPQCLLFCPSPVGTDWMMIPKSPRGRGGIGADGAKWRTARSGSLTILVAMQVNRSLSAAVPLTCFPFTIIKVDDILSDRFAGD